MSETSHYRNTGHSFIYVLSVRDIALSKHRSLIYIRPKCHRCRIIYAQVTHLYPSYVSEMLYYLNTGHSFIHVLNVRDVTLSKHRSLIYIRPKCQRRHII